MPVIYNENLLLAEVAGGNEKSFRQLFDHYFEHICAAAFAFTKSRTYAEEIAQDIFLKIWLHREKLEAVQKFSDYLFVVARNHILNELRKKIHEQSFSDHLLNYFSETASSSEQRLIVRETEQLVNEAVGLLPPQQNLIFCLTRNQGLSHHEIANRLNISRNTVKSHMNKALQSIRNYLHRHN